MQSVVECQLFLKCAYLNWNMVYCCKNTDNSELLGNVANRQHEIVTEVQFVEGAGFAGSVSEHTTK